LFSIFDDLNIVAKIQTKQTDAHHEIFGASTPELTRPGNAAGIAIGQIK